MDKPDHYARFTYGAEWYLSHTYKPHPKATRVYGWNKEGAMFEAGWLMPNTEERRDGKGNPDI